MDNTTQTIARTWWGLALRGIVAILFALCAFFLPGITLTVLVLLFGAFMFVDGIFAFAGAILTFRKARRWWLLLLEGIAGIVVGSITLFWPHITALVFLVLFAGWAIVTGIFEISAAIVLRKVIQGEWQLALGGILSLVFGVLLIALPAAGLLAWTWIIGAYAMLFGIMLIGLAWRLRKMHLDHSPAAWTGEQKMHA